MVAVGQLLQCYVHHLSTITMYGEGNGNPLQCSCLENPVDRGAWRAMVHGVARVGHDLATKPPPLPPPCMLSKYMFPLR